MDVYDNKKPGPHSLSRRNIFGKAIEGGEIQTDPPTQPIIRARSLKLRGNVTFLKFVIGAVWKEFKEMVYLTNVFWMLYESTVSIWLPVIFKIPF